MGRDSKQDASQYEAKVLAKITVNFANTSESRHTPVFIFKVLDDDKIYKLDSIADQ